MKKKYRMGQKTDGWMLFSENETASFYRTESEARCNSFFYFIIDFGYTFGI